MVATKASNDSTRTATRITDMTDDADDDETINQDGRYGDEVEYVTPREDGGDRMAMVREMQEQMANPGRSMKTKKSTGKRLSASDKKKQKKERDKMLRDRMRKKRRNR